MKKTLLLLIGGTFLVVGYKNLPDTMSNGAPAASTGAPDEKHCATSGCHSDFPINSGTAELSFFIENNITQYEAGKTYPITVSISNPGTVRFGFQVVALKNSDNSNAGTIKLLETQRTQITDGYGTMSDRKYITYTYAGTNAFSPGLGKWTFEWTAPETNAEDITFYVASISANNDGTDAGDYAYTKKITLDAPPVIPVSWSVFPNVSNSTFIILCLGMEMESLKIFNSSGEKVFEKSNLEPGTLNLELNKPSGVYFISAVQNGKNKVQNFLIAR